MKSSLGSKFYHLRLLMNMNYTDDDDIGQHLMTISKTAACLIKICSDGMLSVNDIENAAVISSLPEKFSAVTTHFEQQATIENKALTDAIRSSVMNNKNCTATQSISNTANFVKASSAQANHHA